MKFSVNKVVHTQMTVQYIPAEKEREIKVTAAWKLPSTET